MQRKEIFVGAAYGTEPPIMGLGGRGRAGGLGVCGERGRAESGEGRTGARGGEG